MHALKSFISSKLSHISKDNDKDKDEGESSSTAIATNAALANVQSTERGIQYLQLFFCFLLILMLLTRSQRY
ncbi:unnamed protein product [Rotaria sp. Silwood1]|nr:unnamed protein product [Rotaria sp. Silwood1]